MPAVVRLGDDESHACYTTSASANVFANRIPVCRVGDSVCCNLATPPHPTPGVIVDGSPNVFVNGQQIARVGDPTQHQGCGAGSLLSGSPDVYVNGG